MTSCPRAANSLTMLAPTKPTPPVTRVAIRLFSPNSNGPELPRIACSLQWWRQYAVAGGRIQLERWLATADPSLGFGGLKLLSPREEEPGEPWDQPSWAG